MNLLDQIFGKPNFTKFNDCYALTRDRLWQAIESAIHSQLQTNKIVILVCHFSETFVAMQDHFIRSEIEYEVVSRPVDLEWFQDVRQFAGKSVMLVLADLISGAPEETSKQPFDRTQEVSFLVVERHPRIANDSRIMKLAKAVRHPVQMGYFLSLEDALVELAINETTVELMKQMGLEEQELISSNLVTKRVDKLLSRLQKKINNEQPAESAEEWLTLNLKEPE